MELLLEQDYKKIGATQFLRDIYDIVESTEHNYAMRSWEILVEVLADHLHLTRTTHLEVKRRVEDRRLFNIYVKAARKNDPWDHLGMLFEEHELSGEATFLTPRTIVEFMTKITLGEEPYKIETVLDT